MLAEWLELSLEKDLKAGSAHAPEDNIAHRDSGRVCGGRYRLLGPGLLELLPGATEAGAEGEPEDRHPDHRKECAPACVISAGIHGNETAPIELLGESLARLEAGLLRLGAPALVILGNLAAIRTGTRFIDTNLNRLFRRDLDASGSEADRARTLMREVDAFFARHASRQRLHYDLHTAIRDSRYPRFVVNPFADTRTQYRQWEWLAGAGIQAVLHQHIHSWTFSHYSKHYHGAQGFTLELGRARPFGENDLAPLAPMGRLLDALLEGREPVRAAPDALAFFQVEHELMRHSEDFRLCFAEDTPNFSEFPPGTQLATDAKAGGFVVGDTPLRVVFPNTGVELGARAALLVSSAPQPEPG
ncbi:MAG TPA: succinylglutamate desuccinylase [Halomonas sp.]|nr:succinylglutamate desuccinylase [Halomonas sp.]